MPTPVLISFRGRNTMIDGLWTLTTVSPLIASASSLRASEPGAPLGQRNTVGFPAGTTTAGGLAAPSPRCWALMCSATPIEISSAKPADNSLNGFIETPGADAVISADSTPQCPTTRNSPRVIAGVFFIAVGGAGLVCTRPPASRWPTLSASPSLIRPWVLTAPATAAAARSTRTAAAARAGAR